MQASAVALDTTPRRAEYIRGFAILLVIAIVGLAYVKWSPYLTRTQDVAVSHSLGTSIVSGRDAAPPAPSLQTGIDYTIAYMQRIWMALVLGLLLAATVDTLIPRDWLARVLGSRAASSSILGGLLALPGMMCSCCAAPVGLALRKSGASAGSAIAFTVGNPTLNLAVIAWIGLALGWQWALLRVVVGAGLVAAAVALTNRTAPVQVLAHYGSDSTPVAAEGNWALRWLKSLVRYSIVLVPLMLVLVVLLGAARAYLFPAVGADWGNNPLAIIALAVAGTLFPIPTGAEIPIVQTMMGFGLGAGPAAALLVTLAPVSAASLAMLRHGFPTRVILLLAGITATAGIGAALLAIAFGL
jgi:uncharacterized membrane protein YraQ (UPF0718 family)